MANRQDLVISDCEKCKQMTPATQRQYLGCGYLPRLDRVRLTLWEPPRGHKAYSGPTPTVCAGYSTSMPEVTETALARIHWGNGAIVAACDGEQPTEEMLGSVLILEGAYNSLNRWILTPSKDGGGGA